MRNFRVARQNTESSVFLFTKCHKPCPCIDCPFKKVSSEGEHRDKEIEIEIEIDI